MKPQRRAFNLLNSKDFEYSPIWLVELPARGFATAVPMIDDIDVYGPYVALTTYMLADGTCATGYCFAYDCSGHVLFRADGKPIYLADYCDSCSAEEAATFVNRLGLGKEVEQVFPIQFRVCVTYYGAVQEGQITVHD